MDQKDHFTYIPKRNREIPEKRFARWTTNVRPINFFKTWDTTFSPSTETERIVPNSPTCFSQPAPQSKQLNQSISSLQSTAQDIDKENSEAEFLDSSQSAKGSSKKNRSKRAKPKLSQVVRRSNASKILEKEIASHREKSVNLDNVVDKIQERRKSIDLSENRDRSLKEKYLDVRNSSDICTVDKNITKNVTDHHDVTARNKERQFKIGNKTADQNGSDISENENTYEVQEESTTSKKNAKSNNQTKETLSEALTKVIEDENTNHFDKSQKTAAGVENAVKTVENGGKSLHEEEGDDCNIGDESNNYPQTEEIDITHKIPLAQSTAIGIEIEQDFDDEEEEEEEEAENERNTEKDNDEVAENEENTEKDLQRTHSNVSKKQCKENSESYIEKQMLKRKFTLSTPKRNPASTLKKRKIAVTGPIKVQNILHSPLVEDDSHSVEETVNSDSHRKEKTGKKFVNSMKKKKANTTSSLTFNPSQPGPSSMPGKSKPAKTPDLRKAMLLSYAHQTPSGITPSYVAATPVSGPVIRPSQKRRVSKVPAPKEITPNDSQAVDKVRVWKGDGDVKRKSSDIIDLDVILQTFEESAWHFKQNIESEPIKKAVSLFAKKTQLDMRNLIAKNHTLKHLNSSYSKSLSVIRKKRLDLLEMQKKLTSFKAELATLKLEHDATVTKSQRYTEALSFQQAVKESRKELESYLKKNDKSKKSKQLIGPKLDDHSTLCKESRYQLEEIQSHKLKILRTHLK